RAFSTLSRVNQRGARQSDASTDRADTQWSDPLGASEGARNDGLQTGASYNAGSVLQSRRNVLVLALELHAGRQCHRLQQRGEVFLQILLGVGLERRRAEMALQHLARGRG